MIIAPIIEEKMTKLICSFLAFVFYWAIEIEVPKLNYNGELLRFFFSVGAAVASYLLIDVIKRLKARKSILKKREDETNGKL